MAYQVLNFHWAPGSELAEYEVFVKDTKITRHDYIGTTKYGIEETMRKASAYGGMSPHEMDEVF